MYFISIEATKPDDGEIKVPLSAKEYKGENYKIVRTEFKNMGFENIECVGLEDLLTGWLKREETIEGISIGGDSKFEEGDIFKEEAKVVITYHSFKKRK